MKAEVPDFQPAIEAVDDFIGRHYERLHGASRSTLLEVRRRLQNLSLQAAELTRLNNALLDATGMSVELDSSTDTVIFRIGGTEHRLTFKRANPSTPLTLGGQAAVAAYNAATTADHPVEGAELRLELEQRLEGFYQSAHRVLKLLSQDPHLPSVECEAITRVRNNLVEHPVRGVLYSFGVGNSGPRVKPIEEGHPEWRDVGLLPNATAFIRAIRDAMSDERI